MELYNTFLREYPRDDYVPRIYNNFVNTSLNKNNLVQAKVYLTNVMNKLDDDDYCENEEYAYKLIRLGEEYGDIEIRENDASWYELDDFYPIIEVNLPDVYEEIEV